MNAEHADHGSLVALHDRATALYDDVIADTTPPWHDLTPREFADKIGVTVQALANWRYRQNGPPFRQAGRSRACRYQMAALVAWLTGQEAWEVNRSWLARRGAVTDDAPRLHVEYAIVAAA